MKCQILFSGKNKKYILTLLSAALGKRVVKVKENLDGEICFFLFCFLIIYIDSQKISHGLSVDLNEALLMSNMGNLCVQVSICSSVRMSVYLCPR